MTKSEREDFRQFCINATDVQLQNIAQKERKAARTDEERAIYAAIAEDVAASRNLL